MRENKENIIKDIILTLNILLYVALIVYGNDYRGYSYSSYLHYPDIWYEATAGAFMSVRGGVGAASINPALLTIHGDIDYIYSNLNKSYDEYFENDFQGAGISLNQFNIALSSYNMISQRFQVIWDSIRAYEFINRISVSYEYSDELSLGLTVSRIGRMANKGYLDYFEITADDLPEFFSYDAGIYRQISLINRGNISSDGSFALSVINIQNFQRGPIYSNYILPVILNIGISNKWQFTSENYFYKNISINWGAGYRLYLNNRDFYNIGLGSEIGIMDYLFIGLGYYWSSFYNFQTYEKEYLKGFTYGFGINMNMSELFDAIPLTVNLKLVRMPQIPYSYMNFIDMISTGIQCEIGYEF